MEITRETVAAATAVELRKMASQEKVPGASKGKKADLTAALLEIISKSEAAAAPKPATAKRVCEICKTRPQMPKGRMLQVHGVSFPYCEPCLIEADWENIHSDDAHQTGNQQISVADCWICHPELNRASADYAGHSGTSRAGMRMTVPQRAAGEVKAGVVAKKLTHNHAVTIFEENGRTILTAVSGTASVRIVWDAAGRFVYGPSVFTAVGGKTRKVMNVSGALRALGF